MKSFLLQNTLGSLVALLSTLALGNAAPLPWSKSYTLQHGVPVQTLFGTVYAHPTAGAGFVLLGASQETSSGESRLLPSLGRFTDTGELLWSVWMDGGPGSSQPELFATGDSTRVQATYLTDSGAYRIGSYRGGNRTKVFAFEVEPFDPDFETITLNETPQFLDNGETALVELGDGAVKVTVLDAAGAKKIDKVYTSPAFAVDPEGFIPPTGALGFEPLSDGSGYILTVSLSVPSILLVPPFSFSYDNTISVLNLDNSGTVRWARTMTMNDTGGEVSATSWPGPAGQVIVALSETTAFTSLSEDGHLLRFAANGTLTWARTIADTAPNFLRVEGTDLWYFALSGNRADVKTLRMNEATGSVIAQATLDTGSVDEGVGVGFVGGRIYYRLQSVTGTTANAPRQAYVLSLDALLQNPVARKYNNPIANLTMSRHLPSDGFIFSPHDAAGVVDVVSLDTALQPVTDCNLFTNATINVINTGINAVPLSITTANLNVTVANASTVLTPVDITLQPLTLAAADLCGGGNTPVAPVLTIRRATGSNFEIRFGSQSGVRYEVRFSATVTGPYDTIVATLNGTGAELVYNFTGPVTGNGYYVVRAVRP
jgi:hypothetical protein